MYGGQQDGQGYGGQGGGQQGGGQGYGGQGGGYGAYGTPPGAVGGGQPQQFSSAPFGGGGARQRGASQDDQSGWQPDPSYGAGQPQSYGQGQQAYGQEGTAQAYSQGQRHDGQPFGGAMPKTPSLENMTRPDVAAQGVAAAAAMFAGDSGMAQRLLEQQGRAAAAAYIPGAAAGWSRARCYFAVSHSSVAAKLRAVLAPWTKRHWRRKRADELDEGHGHALPIHDVNAPDLYVPVVAFVTFALTAGYARGVKGEFSPDALGTIFTRCVLIQLFETGFYAMALWSLGARGVPWLDVLSYTGYKYVALCVNSVAYLVGGDRPYLLTMVYTGLSASYFMLKTAAQIVPAELQNTKARREVVVMVMGLTQFASIWVLGKAGA
jgi:hypothetical protein